MDWRKLTLLWAKALRKSPASSVLFNVRKQMETFLGSSKKGIFDEAYDASIDVVHFQKMLLRR